VYTSWDARHRSAGLFEFRCLLPCKYGLNLPAGQKDVFCGFSGFPNVLAQFRTFQRFAAGIFSYSSTHLPVRGVVMYVVRRAVHKMLPCVTSRICAFPGFVFTKEPHEQISAANWGRYISFRESLSSSTLRFNSGSRSELGVLRSNSQFHAR
jgi:hypothetical protein